MNDLGNALQCICNNEKSLKFEQMEASRIVYHNFNSLRLAKKKIEIFFGQRAIEMWKTIR